MMYNYMYNLKSQTCLQRSYKVKKNRLLSIVIAILLGTCVFTFTSCGGSFPIGGGIAIGGGGSSNQNGGGSSGSDENNNNTEETVKLIFDESKMECHESYDTGDLVKSGKNVSEDSYFVFKEKLGNGKKVKAWCLNGKELEQKGSQMGYTVKFADAVGKKIKITIKSEDAKNGKLEFNDNLIKCQLDDKEIKNNTIVKEGAILEFEVKDSKTQHVGDWQVNDAKFIDKEGNPQREHDFRYYVKADDIKDGKIKISYRTAEKITLKFEKPMECKTIVNFFKPDDGGEFISTGGEVFENTLLLLRPSIEAGKTLTVWTINGTELPLPKISFPEGDSDEAENKRKDNRDFFNYNKFWGPYIDDAKDENGKKVITISYETRVAKAVRLKFDNDAIECKKMNSIKKSEDTALVIPDNDDYILVYENDMLSFTAKEFEKGKVCKWTVNDEEKESSSTKPASYTEFLTERNVAEEEDDDGNPIYTFTVEVSVEDAEED